MRQPFKVIDIVPRVVDSKKGHVGFCTHCGGKATKEAHFSEEGIDIIEKYCNDCMQPDKFARLQERYGRS